MDKAYVLGAKNVNGTTVAWYGGDTGIVEKFIDADMMQTVSVPRNLIIFKAVVTALYSEGVTVFKQEILVGPEETIP